jgi:hypothetical protein
MEPAVTTFITDIEQCGAKPRVLGDFVVYEVVPGFGAFAGKVVETAVAIEEVARWPQVPPHWLHFPACVAFQATNSQASNMNGWIQHSRQIHGWGQSPSAANDWLGHVRSVLGEATQ